MEEFKTQDGIIKIKEIIPLNTWFFPIEVNARINTIKRVMRHSNFSKIEHIFCKRRAFLTMILQHYNITSNGLWDSYVMKMVAQE